MYPGMIEKARKEGHKQALQSFEFANKVEGIHANLYQKALDNLGNNEPVDYYVCQVCGNTVENEAPDRCPICGVSRSMFIKID
jgi:rubrerythrin